MARLAARSTPCVTAEEYWQPPQPAEHVGSLDMGSLFHKAEGRSRGNTHLLGPVAADVLFVALVSLRMLGGFWFFRKLKN